MPRKKGESILPPGEQRERIFQAALRLFAHQGFSATGMRQVAREAGVHESSIYHWFSGKDRLLDEVFKRFEGSLPPRQSLAPSPEQTAGWSKAIRVQGLGGFLYQGFLAYVQEAIGSGGEALWYVISAEQYRDPRAGRIVLNETDRVMHNGCLLYRFLIDAGFIKAADPQLLAWEMNYTGRAIHLEYIVRRLHGLEPELVLDRMRQFCDFFAASHGAVAAQPS